MGQHLQTKINISECLLNIYPCFLIMLDKKNSMWETCFNQVVFNIVLEVFIIFPSLFNIFVFILINILVEGYDSQTLKEKNN